MKVLKSLFPVLIVAVLIVGCTGPRAISPAIVQQGVAMSVGYSALKYPTAVPYLRAATPVICSAANSSNLAPAQVIAAVESSGASSVKTPEGVLILNTALLLYIGVWQSYGEDALNNSPQLRLYLQATCDGMTAGLPQPAGAAKALQAPAKSWPLVAF